MFSVEGMRVVCCTRFALLSRLPCSFCSSLAFGGLRDDSRLVVPPPRALPPFRLNRVEEVIRGTGTSKAIFFPTLMSQYGFPCFSSSLRRVVEPGRAACGGGGTSSSRNESSKTDLTKDAVLVQYQEVVSVRMTKNRRSLGTRAFLKSWKSLRRDCSLRLLRVFAAAAVAASAVR